MKRILTTMAAGGIALLPVVLTRCAASLAV